MSGRWVGLTGGVGCGKTTAAHFFAACGVTVVDADAVVGELTAPGGEGLVALARAVGEWVVDGEGRYDRAAVRVRVFADVALRRRVEAVLHPMVREVMRKRLAAAPSCYALGVVPLLFESGGWGEAFWHVAAVECNPATQAARVAARDGVDDAAAIVAAQMPAAERRRRAGTVIVNDGDLSALFAEVYALHQRWRDGGRGGDGAGSGGGGVPPSPRR